MMTIEQIKQCTDELEQLGWIRRNGKFRNGQPVFVLTKLGRAMKALGSDDPMTMTKQ